MNGLTQKVGRLTVALGLMVFGFALLADNIAGNTGWTSWVIKLWPVLLIGMGAEYLIRTVLSARKPDGERVLLRFDFGGVFLLVLVIALSFGITTFRTMISAMPGRIIWGGGPGIERRENSKVPLENARALAIDVGAGSVKLEQGASMDEVQVEATYSAHGFTFDPARVKADLDRIKTEVSRGEVITIRAEIPNDLDNVSVGYTIYAPPGLKIKAETRAGTIEVRDYKGDLQLTSGFGRIFVTASTGTLEARSNAGSVIVREFEGPVTAHASVGNLDVQHVTGALLLDSGTGTINVQEFQGGKMTAETRTGSINASTGSVLAGDVIVKTSAGSLSLTVPKESSARVSAQTRMGSLTLPPSMGFSGEGPSKSGAGTLGDGKYSVTLEAGTGSIHFGTR